MTLAHPAAVLPFARTRLPMPALVIGSMVPDVPVFLSWQHLYAATHSVAGVVGVDMLATCALVVLWVALLRDALVDMAPVAIRSRLAPPSRLPLRWWLLVPLAAWIGAGSHVLWDSFTHTGRWGPRHVPWLDQTWHGVVAYRWLQYASGVLGLVAVGVVVTVTLMRMRPTQPDRRRHLPSWVLPGALALALAVGVLAAVRSVPLGIHDMAFNGVVDSVVSATALMALACLAWQASRLVSPARTRPRRRR